jgi:N-acetylglutamate synthase-like GNAT family acetyltransferase
MRTAGIGARIIGELQRRARREGFEQLCAFTHSPAYFMRLGFSIVPHLSLPEKVLADCAGCGLFRQCGKYAVVAPIAAVREPSAEAFEPATAAATGLSA